MEKIDECRRGRGELLLGDIILPRIAKISEHDTKIEATKPRAKAAKAAALAAKEAVVPAEARTIRVDGPDLEEMLGPAKYVINKAEEKNEIGLTNGLAYTAALLLSRQKPI